MKTLQEIKEEVAKEQGYEDWFTLEVMYEDKFVCHIVEVMDVVCKRYAEAAIDACAQNAETDCQQDEHHAVDTESILQLKRTLK